MMKLSNVVKALMSVVLIAGALVIPTSASANGSCVSGARWDGGGGDHLWSTASNWIGDSVPNSSSDVCLEFANVLIESPASVNSILIEDNASLTVQTSGRLSIATTAVNHGILSVLNHLEFGNTSGDATDSFVSDGTLNVLAASYLYGQTIDISGTVSLGGVLVGEVTIHDATVELGEDEVGMVEVQEGALNITDSTVSVELLNTGYAGGDYDYLLADPGPIVVQNSELNVTIGSSYTPAVGDEFIIALTTAITGSFTETDDLPDGLIFTKEMEELSIGSTDPDPLFAYRWTVAEPQEAEEPTTPSAPEPQDPVSQGTGYWMVGADGAVYGYGDAATNIGDLSEMNLKAPIAGISPSATGGGYWLVGEDGGVFAFGSAPFVGSAADLTLNSPVTGISGTPTGDGYWLVGADGGVFAYGDAPFAGSAADIPLVDEAIGITGSSDGDGYWLVAKDGGVFAYGDAEFYGSAANLPLNSQIVGIAMAPGGNGYWLAAADGGVFTYGDAEFYGSMGGEELDSPIVGIRATADGSGYWLTAADGGVFAFGSVPYLGNPIGETTDVITQ